MARSKPLTPQEIYRQRKQREEREKTAYLPPGLINHGNTCFMNSVLQGLLATRMLADLVYFNPIPPEIQGNSTSAIVSTRSPQLLNGHGFAGRHKLPYVSGMPIGDVFLETLDKAWIAQASRRREILSPRYLLGTLGRKYDQYLDFAQQDAHEFLRILLDAMRMEELDIIKVRQPLPPPKKKWRKTITPENAREASSTHSSQSSVAHARANPPTSTSPKTNGSLSEEKLPLTSFVDLIFGGQLTSILVCQKCKHVSQTYEDFNDISLSLKPEDYANRKRDRFKKIVGRLTSFPLTYSNNAQAKDRPSHPPPTNLPPVPSQAIEMLRSSSVPPTPSKEKQSTLSGGGLEPPIEGPRRRSLDFSVRSSTPDQAVVEDGSTSRAAEMQSQEKFSESDGMKDLDEDCGMLSDGSHVIVNVTGPEDRHVEFVEPKWEKASDLDVKEKKPEEAAWTKIGRRISLNLGLGRQKDRDSKERERKARSMDRASLNAEGIKEDEEVSTSTTMRKSPSLAARPPTSGTSKVSPLKSKVPSEEATDAQGSQTPAKQPTSLATPTLKLDVSPKPVSDENTSSATPKFPTIQRSRSPKPPKPSAAETEYLRKVLADVSFPSSNPFAILRPPLLHGHHDPTLGGVGDKDKSAGSMWLGLGARTFSGVEECLRMFTAVEILDGENMVGCRRCWKIQNGVLQSKKEDSDEDDEEEGEDGPSTVPRDSAQNSGENAHLTPMAHHPTPIIITPTPSSPVHIQASQSTPAVAFDSQRELCSISSLPTSLSDANLNLNLMKDKKDDEDSSDSPLSLSIVSEGSEYTRTTTTDVDSGQSQGPGLTIPVISTTAPVDVQTISFSTPSDSGSESHYSSASEGRASPRPAKVEKLNRAPYVRLAAGLSNGDTRDSRKASISRDSLMIPPRRRYPTRDLSSETSTEDGSSEDESDASVVTSGSGDSSMNAANGREGPCSSAQTSVSKTPSSQQSSTQSQSQSSSERPPKKPKPVIMRPAYKRYLIATPPPVLVIHLKRFQQTLKAPLMLSFSNGFKKLDDFVSFPEYLDLSPFLAPRKEDFGLGKKSKEKGREKVAQKLKKNPQGERCMYRLYAVVVHIGNMLGGHYIAYTALPNEPRKHHSANKSTSEGKAGGDKHESKTPSDLPYERQWAYISDTHVRLTTVEEVLNSKAYICMYERC